VQAELAIEHGPSCGRKRYVIKRHYSGSDDFVAIQWWGNDRDIQLHGTCGVSE
jgi:hypothetical protein